MVDERSTSEPIERIGGTEMGSSSPDTQASKSGTVTDRQTGHKPDKQQHPQTAKADVSRADKTRGDEKEGTGRELGNEAKDGKKSKSKSKESVGRRIMNKLPKWLSDSLVDVRTWKTFTRCMIATFGAMVLMLAQPCEWGVEWDLGYHSCLSGFDSLESRVSDGEGILLLSLWVLGLGRIGVEI